jgi:hypothetical protein
MNSSDLSIEYLSIQHGIPLFSDFSCTSNTANFDFIKRCIDMCANKHSCLQDTAALFGSGDGPLNTSTKTTPARLLDVEFVQQSQMISQLDAPVRLVDVTGQCPRYLTLSHCWGGSLPTTVITTSTNLASYKNEINVDTLPQTFRDAISITRQLHYRYLWIDALCIIQDCSDDWEKEASKMGTIFAQSYLSIAATSSRDGSGGCFTKSGNTAKPPTGSDEKVLNLDSDSICLRVVSCSALQNTWMKLLAEAPISQRGWVCQERILSPRTIHYTARGLIWECRQCYCSEDGWHSKWTSARTTAQLTYRSFAGPRLSYNDWYEHLIDHNYSGRHFTRPEDRLIAVSGLARLYSRYLRSPYFAGIWKSFFISGLCWRAMKPSRMFRAPRRPTWSWASHDFQIMWETDMTLGSPAMGIEDCTLQSIRIQYEGKPAEEFGLVDEGYATIRGILVEAPFNPRDWTVNNVWLDYAIPVGNLSCLVLLNTNFGIYLLLLRRRNIGYERVGLARVNGRSSEAIAGLNSAASRDVVIL